MRFARFSFRSLASILFLLTTASVAFSQSDRGSVAGTIQDSSGGAVQGATITATGVETGSIYTAASTSTGAYRLAEMQVGVYNIAVTAR